MVLPASGADVRADRAATTTTGPRPPSSPQATALPDPPPLRLPVEGIRPEDLRDTYDAGRENASRRHEAIDIAAPRGTPVVAVDDGTLVKLFNSRLGGLTIYHFDPQRRHAYYYAHLDRYAEGVREGMALRRGDLIGYVGTTGNAPPDSPHLHFAIFRLGPQKRWWEGEPINPYPFLRGG